MANQVLIRKGTHGNTTIKLALFRREIERTVIFDQSCIYDLNSQDQFDVNKLFGIGFFPSHMNNSARWGWNWNLEKNQIFLYSFIHRKGKFEFEYVTSVNIDEPITLGIMFSGGSVIFRSIKQNGEITVRNIPFKYSPFGYELSPYFGGNQFAPHDMKIKFL